MIFLDHQNDFYPLCIFKELMGISPVKKIESLKELPHQELTALLKALNYERSRYPSGQAHPIKERIKLVEQAIQGAYGDTYPPDEDWKTWWVLPD